MDVNQAALAVGALGFSGVFITSSLLKVQILPPNYLYRGENGAVRWTGG